MDDSNQNTSETIVVHIGGRNFNILCAPDERENLLAAAESLKTEIAALQGNSATPKVSLETAAILTALNLTDELVRHRASPAPAHIEPGYDVQHLIDKIESALED